MTKKSPKIRTLGLGAAAIAGLMAVTSLSAPALADHGGKRGKMKERHQAHLEQVDTNKDGKISREEAEAAQAKRFAAVDANGDGKVSFEEMQAHRDKKRAEHAKKRQEHAKKRFESRDKNGDGVLTADEMGRGADHFEKIDTNGDGYITEEERKEAHKKMREMRKKHRHKHQHGGE